MLNLCLDIQRDSEYESRCTKTFNCIIKWYKKAQEDYSELLRKEMSSSIQNIEKGFVDSLCEEEADLFDLDFQFSTKLSFFSVADALEKIIFCQYSYCLDRTFCSKYSIDSNVVCNNLNIKWLDTKLNDVQVIEILSKVLADENQNIHFDLATLHEDRSVRSKGTHVAYFERCLSTLRCYNTIREMIVFLDSSLDHELLRFDYPGNNVFDIDDFKSRSKFSFEHYTTILITESVHDVPEQYLANVANLNWDIVVDLDGYTKEFGLAKTIDHVNVQHQLLTEPNTITSLDIINHSITRWYKCGDYQLRMTGLFSYYDNVKRCKLPASLVIGKTPYCEKPSLFDRKESSMLERIVSLAYRSERPINIVVLSNNSKLIKNIADSCITIDTDFNFFCTWIGFGELPDDIYFDQYDDNENNRLIYEHIFHYNCTFDRFFEKVSECKNSLGWQTKHSEIKEFRLPSEKMPEGKIISENDRIALDRYFDVLYLDAEYDQTKTKEDIEIFYNGGKASWSVIASDEALELSDKVNSFIDEIKKSMGISQNDSSKQIFFVKHASGQGGTTLARQIAWKLHRQYPVLELKHYPQNDFQQLLQRFYDRVIDSAPFVILCDDSSTYLNELISLVSGVQRRFSLIISVRENNLLLKEYRNASYLTFTTLNNDKINALKIKFRNYSPLSEAILNEKDSNFEKALSDKRPFFIGLYYKEEKFDIENYVQKTFDNAPEERYRKALACIALCDIMGQKYVPAIIIQKMLGYSLRSSLFSQYPDATSLILMSEEGVPCYSFKHSLLAEKYISLYSKHIGKSNPDIYFQLAKAVVEFSGEACKNQISIPTIDLLSYIMIKKRDDTELSSGSKVSKLLSNLGTEEQKINLLEQLVDTFSENARYFLSLDDFTEDESHKKIINLVSHAYAHIGRIYSKSPMNNYVKAAEYLGSARSFMIGNDPDIYHMEGTAYHEQLKYLLENYRTNPKEEDIDDILSLFNKAVSLYDNSIQYNSPEYGIPSKLTLCKDVLNYLCETRHIKQKNDIEKMKVEEQEIYSCFLDALDEVEQYNIEENVIAEERIHKCREWLDSGMIFGNSSEVVSYFQQKYDVCDKTDFSDTWRTLLNLTYAQINHFRKKYSTVAFHRTIEKNKLLQIRANIQTLLEAPFSKESSTEYFRRTRLFSEWFQIAKALNISILECLGKAKAWLAMEEEYASRMKCRRNPQPWYYLTVFSYLEALEGGTNSLEEAQKYQREIHNEYKFVYQGIYAQTRINDLLVIGSGAGQLLNVRHCEDETDMLAEAAKLKATPVTAKGVFSSTAAGAGNIQLFTPIQFNKLLLHVRYGKNYENTLNDQLKEHKVQTLIGFATSQPCALSNYTKDESAGESLVVSEILFDLNKKSGENSVKKKKTAKKRGRRRH